MRRPDPLYKVEQRGEDPDIRLAALLIRQAAYTEYLRERKKAHLTKKRPSEEAAELLTSEEWCPEFGKRLSDRFERECWELEQMPDAVSYDDFPLPALHDEEPMPWDEE